MNTLSKLQKCNSIDELISSFSLNITPKKFSYILYVLQDNQKYKDFTIPKSGGGIRTISCPEPTLKYLQKEFNKIFISCIDEIKQINPSYLISNHAFEKYKSIASNAYKHKNKKYILNIDIKDFFSSIHYGRIIGFLQKDRYLKLSEKTAKIIAKLATYNGTLPQGSPLSPILASLIGNIIDARLLKLAKKYKLTYTRYADDITFSSNLDFSSFLLEKENNIWVPNKNLISAVESLGFKINNKKTRYTDKYHKQIVTGLVVNKFVNTDKNYKKKTRAMVYQLFKIGEFKLLGKNKDTITGSIDQLIGRLNHSISIKYKDRILNPFLLNNVRSEVKNKLRDNLINIIQYRGESNLLPKDVGINKLEESIFIEIEEAKKLLSFNKNKNDKLIIPDDSIKQLRNVLFYKYFISFAMNGPVIITEGKTDFFYFKAAMKSLSMNNNFKFIRQNNRSLEKLGLSGGTDPINKFIKNVYHDEKFVNFSKLKVRPKYPVIFILDYDDGLDKVSHIIKEKFKVGTQFAQIKENIYILLLKNITLNSSGKMDYTNEPSKVCIENLILLNGNKINVINDEVDYEGTRTSKSCFAKEVSSNLEKFDFSEFKNLFDKIEDIVTHFHT